MNESKPTTHTHHAPSLPSLPTTATPELLEAIRRDVASEPAPNETREQTHARLLADIDRNYMRVAVGVAHLTMLAKCGIENQAARDFVIGDAMAKIIEGTAANYITSTLDLPERPGEVWSVTFQRDGGVTPQQALGLREAEREQLDSLLRRALGVIHLPEDEALRAHIEAAIAEPPARSAKILALRAAIRRITVDLPDDQPNGPAEVALLALDKLCNNTAALWRVDELKKRIEAIRAEMANLCTALADDTLALRLAADAYFGEDFKRPA